MNKKAICIRHSYRIFLFLLIAFSSFAQEKELFEPRSPISFPIVLAGSFGELRNNHFHAGIDIKPLKWNKAGDKVYAIEDGFISRIKVQAGGYGNAIYIDHPGAYTSVYGHLLKFTDSISHYVKQMQYANESFEVDLYPEPGKFQVRKGDLISWVGNSGRSHGPHLHFEIRNTLSEIPINPYHFGIGPQDKRQPELTWLKISHMKPDSTVVDSEDFKINRVRSGLFKLSQDTIYINAWRIGVELNAYDQMNGAPNKNGIYELSMKLDDELVYLYKLDSISFDESRHINAHINYPDFVERKRRYQRCYKLDADPLSIYIDTFTNSSIFPLYAEKAQKVEIITRDIKGNKSSLKFWVKRKKDMHPHPPLHYNYVLKEGEGHLIPHDEHILFFPDTSLYQKSYIHLSSSNSIEAPMVSEQIFLKTQGTIFKNWIDIFIKKPDLPEALLEKTVVVECSGDQLSSYGGEIFEDFITSKIIKFGNYALFIDTIPPEIKAINFSYDMREKKSMSFTINDNLLSEGMTQSLGYNAYIDDKWVLFDFDAKSKKLTHYFEDNLVNGEHILKLIVHDERKNISIFEDKFIVK